LSRKIDYTPYAHLTTEEISGELLNIEKYLQKYAADVGINFINITCRENVLLDIIERVEKRRVYLGIFHKIKMSEKYEAALYCFWIIKLSPFFDINNRENNINIRFAAYLFLEIIGKVGRKEYPMQQIKFGKEHVEGLIYPFSYWDISKEAMMMLADLLLRQLYPTVKVAQPMRFPSP